MANDVYGIQFEDDGRKDGQMERRNVAVGGDDGVVVVDVPDKKMTDSNNHHHHHNNHHNHHHHNNRHHIINLTPTMANGDENILFRKDEDDDDDDDDDDEDDDDNDNQNQSSLLGFRANAISVSLSFIFLSFGVLCNLFVLAIIHERVPDQEPLPDISFDLLPKKDSALYLSEYIIIFMSTSVLTMIACHRFRWILLGRLFTILAILYLLRAVCMAVTQVPVSNQQYFCSPKQNLTEKAPFEIISIVLERVMFMGIGMGLSMNGRHTYCGDFIFSGHTTILVLSNLFLVYYWLSSRKIIWRLIRYCYHALVILGIVAILLSRGHYLVDIILALFFTKLVFHLYHILCHHAVQAKMNAFEPNPTKVWWFFVIRIMECNTINHQIVIQNRFQWPWANITRPRKK